MGANEPPDMDEVGMKATPDGQPVHRVYVDGFFMDKTDVTNGEFAKFVKATGYITVAERKPRAEDFPSYDPAEPKEPKKVHRGSSYLCIDQYCSRYIVGTRGKGEVSTGTNHLGFRCVMKS